VQFFVMLS